MCMLCNSQEFKDAVVDRGYSTIHLKEDEIDLGKLGAFTNQTNLFIDGYERKVYLESCCGLNDDADICNITQIEIKYCPFCGKELDF